MGALCEEAIAMRRRGADRRATQRWPRRSPPLDSEIDRKERDIETLCLKLLLQQQPVARDLRQISAALKMITDMERIGDQAEDIAEIIGFLDGRRPRRTRPTSATWRARPSAWSRTALTPSYDSDMMLARAGHRATTTSWTATSTRSKQR